MFRLETFGVLRLAADGRALEQPRMRLALLARLAARGDQASSRDEVLACFWPERDTDSARHSLDQLLYETRRVLRHSLFVGTDVLKLDASVITSDVQDFLLALRRGDLLAAVSLYGGPFLNGFYLPKTLEFERWVESTRASLETRYHQALEQLAHEALTSGDHAGAIRFARRWAASHPVSSSAALMLMRALAASGERAAALQWAQQHERIVRVELETEADSEIRAYVEELRAPPLPRAPAAIRVDRDLTAHTEDVVQGRRARSVGPTLVAALVMATAIAFGVMHRTPTTTDTTNGVDERSRRTTSVAAYDLYLRGRDPISTRSDSSLRRSIEYLNEAIALDSSFAAAYAALASLCATAAWGSDHLSLRERQSMYANAAFAADRAVALDSTLADAHSQRAYVKLIGHDVAGSIAEIQRAIALDSTDADAREIQAKAYEYAGRPNEAIDAMRSALHSKPLGPAAHAELGYALYFGRQYDAARAELAMLSKLQPPLRRAPRYLAEVYLSEGKWDDAISLIRVLGARQSYRERALLGYALARSGATSEARGILQQMLSVARDSAYAFEVAEIYAGLGNRDQAYYWLDQSVDDFSMSAAIGGPLFDELRADPRFDRVRRRLGLGPDLPNRT